MAQTTSGPGNQNLKGFRWADSSGGFALFNTIVPPTSTQYPFAWCAMGRTNGSERLRRAVPVHKQQPPRRLQFLVRRRQCSLSEVVDLDQDVLALGTKANGEIVSSDNY